MAESAPESASAEGWRKHQLWQLYYFRSLSLRTKLEAVQGMADVVRRFEQMRRAAKMPFDTVLATELADPAQNRRLADSIRNRLSEGDG